MTDDLERDAYNATFYELGLRWHWDGETYASLLRHSEEPEARIRHYIETRQPHLLKAYDADALAGVIQQRAAQHKPCAANRFDWAQSLGRELGA
ncbi:hypothetical protein [Piscinibacter sp.]|uniref:hypothetical protein n=1 Tax=Piscinibacter sp. TaxID=1903157 RepID=UPI002C467252|nr:hypothetical protein [Albitalea sp.]HUG22708.1 hypothetical protein [Albitalea sp.]